MKTLDEEFFNPIGSSNLVTYDLTRFELLELIKLAMQEEQLNLKVETFISEPTDILEKFLKQWKS